MTSGSGSAFIAFVENSLEVDAESALRLIATRPELLLQRKPALFARLADAWQGVELSRLRDDVPTGQTWPVLAIHSHDVVAAAKDVYLPSAIDRTPPGEIAAKSEETTKSLLLYADGLLLPNPFRASHYSVAEQHGDTPSDYAFLVALASVCRVAQLLRADIVRVGEPEQTSEIARRTLAEEQSFKELAAQFGRNLYFEGVHRDFNQWLLIGAGNFLLERALWQFAYNADNLAGSGNATLLFESDLDRAAAEALIRSFAALDARGITPEDRLALIRLLSLQLPGVSRLGLRDVVHIRDDEAFGRFRVDMAASLRDAAAPLERRDLATAQRIIEDHMAAGLSRLTTRTRRGRLADATSGEVVGWLIGAAMANSLDGLRGLLALLVGKTVTDVVRASPTRSDRALRAHYVALSARPTHFPRPIDLSDRERTPDRDDGPALAILDDLLDTFDNDDATKPQQG